MLLGVVVPAASLQDRDGAKGVLRPLRHCCLRLRLIGADGGDAGSLLGWLARLRPRPPLRLEIVKRAEKGQGCVVQPKRGSVERTLGWLKCYRRLSQDYETLPATREAMISIAMIRLMLARLTRGTL